LLRTFGPRNDSFDRAPLGALSYTAILGTLLAMVPYQTIFEELEKRAIRYLIVGGFAVNLHQVQRATVDLDLMIQLERDNILKFLELMSDLKFEPRAPVPASDLAIELKRDEWIKTKGMLVFTFCNAGNPMEQIDVFTKEEIPFPELWERRKEVVVFGINLKVIGKADLITLKNAAGRERDKLDVHELSKTS